MTASFLGVMAHFYADHKRHNITIAVKEMPSPHTADNILRVVENVLADWNIPLYKIRNTITDNGSNMVKAFKHDATSDDNEFADEMDQDDKPSAIEDDDDYERYG